jgi:hypothetical protein
MLGHSAHGPLYTSTSGANGLRRTIAKDLFTSSHAPRYVYSYDPTYRNARVETHRGEFPRPGTAEGPGYIE